MKDKTKKQSKGFKSQSKPEPESSKQVVSVKLDVSSLQTVIKEARNDGYSSGFNDGVKYIVTLAENLLVKHEKLASREALSKDRTHMPTWWIATLMEAYKKEVKSGTTNNC
jgi:hypothetical protein